MRYLLILLLFACASFGAADIYVATAASTPAGNDAAAGTIAAPLLTIAHAKVHALAGGAGSTVYLRGGTYNQTTTFETYPMDGTEGNPYTFKSYPGEAAVISGGVSFTGDWVLDSGSIYKRDMGAVRFNSLFANDKRLTRAREPEEGDNYLIASVPAATAHTAFMFAGTNISSTWTNLTDVEVVCNILNASRYRIASVVDANKFVTFDNSRSTGYDEDYTVGSGRYFVDNVFEGLDTPGEWYLNSVTGYLYYWPLSSESINSVEFTYPVMTGIGGHIINLYYCDYITLENITIAYTDWSYPAEGIPPGWGGTDYGKAINLGWSSNLTVKNCTIKHCGSAGIVGYETEYLTLKDNQIYDIGGAPVASVRFSMATGVANNWTVENRFSTITGNVIHDYGKVFPESIGIYITGRGHFVNGNHIYNGTRNGIAFQSPAYRSEIDDTDCAHWNINIISNNNIHDVMQDNLDGGGISWSGEQPGTLLQNNYIHDIRFTSKTQYHYNNPAYSSILIMGLYADSWSKGVIVRNNVLENCETGMAICRSQNHTIRNNIFINNIYRDLIFSGRTYAPNVVKDLLQPLNVVSKNIFYNHVANSLPIEIWSDTDPSIGSSDYNLFFTDYVSNTNYALGLSTWTTRFDANNVEDNSSTSDPLFSGYDNGDFALLPASPAFALGYVDVDLTNKKWLIGW